MNMPKDMIITTVSEFGIIKSIKIQLVGMWQKTVVEFADSNQAVQLTSRWLFLIKKDSVHVAMAIGDHNTWASRDQFRVLLFTLPADTTAHDLSTLLDETEGKTCVINRLLKTGNQFHCAVVCFESDEMLELELIQCGRCGCFGHSALECDAFDVSPPVPPNLTKRPFFGASCLQLAKLYTKKNVSISCPAAFSGKLWAQVVSFASPLGGSPSGSGLLSDNASLSFSSSCYQVNGLGDCLAVLKQSMEILSDQVSGILKKLSFFELVPLTSPSCAPPLAVSVHSSPVVDSNMVLDDVLASSAPSLSGGGNSAAVLSLSGSKILISKLGGLKSKMSGLEALFSSILVRLDLLCSGSIWRIATCNVKGINNLVKQKDIIYWHKNSGNLISILTKTKLKDKICPWLASKFDGVHVFSSGLNSGYVGASVVVVMNNSLAKHINKVFEVLGHLLCIRLLFKNKLLVFVLGLYTGVSSTTWFSQAGEINSLIAITVNESSFVIFSGNFNENGSHKYASFKRCFDLGLVNSLNRSSFVKTPTWYNSCGVAKTIDYVFVSSNLVGALVNCGVVGVEEFFDTNHKAVSVFVGLGGLLNVQLNLLYRQANKNCWKYDVKSTDEIKWSNFRVTTANNASMFLDEFVTTKWFSDLDVIWDAVRKTIILSAEGTFRKKWFKGFNSVFNKVSSRFHKLELLMSKLVRSFHLVSNKNFALLLDTWNKLDSVGASSIKSLFLSGSGFNAIHSKLSKARKSYCSSKLIESKRAEEFRIRQAVKRRMESFEVDKGYTIRSVLECPFCKVVLDHLVVEEELVLEPGLIKSKVDVIMEVWTWKHVVVSDISDVWMHQFQSLEYVFNGAFSNVMCSISFEEMFSVVSNLSDGKVTGFSSITNELWKHCNNSFDVLCEDNFSVLKETTIQLPIFAISSVVEDALEKNQELWLVLQDMQKAYDSVGWEHLRRSLNGLTSFLAASAFVDDMIWVGSSQAATQYILDITSEFFRFNNISINNDKTVTILINCHVVDLVLTVSGLPISIVKKGKLHRYLGIFLSSEGLSRPSLAKAHADIWFFVNLVLKKAISDM
ncbi:hypothetical protein G9A89_006641 [Geosiphon pyriformis]|nr:hypothetical protein G9A89_006641 [Geosiphon pyriformis]